MNWLEIAGLVVGLAVFCWVMGVGPYFVSDRQRRLTNGVVMVGGILAVWLITLGAVVG